MKIRLYNTISHLECGGKELLKGDIIGDVREYLKVKKKGSYFAKKHNKYAGNFKYFCTPKGKFMTGFFPWVYQFLKESHPDVHIEVIDFRQNLREFPSELNFKACGFDMSQHPYEYQGTALKSCNNYESGLYWPRGIIDAATNAGKNTIIAGIHKNVGGRTLMLIHSREIFNQAVEFFGSEFDVGRVQGRHTELEKPFVVAMYKTLFKRVSQGSVKKQLNYVNNLIVDESHRATASEYAHTIGLIDAGQRYFVSGTPLKMPDPIKKMSAIGLSGNILYQIKNKELIDRGVSLNVKVKMYKSTERYEDFGGYDQCHEMCVMKNKLRRDLICEYLTYNPERRVVISVNRIEHGNFLMEKLGRMFNAREVYGDTKDRDKLINEFKNEGYNILVTTLLKEGVNTGIDSIVYANGGKAEISVLQYVGRALRKMGTADTAHIVDFFDNCRYLDKHSRSRTRIYRNEGFDIEYNYNANSFGTPK